MQASGQALFKQIAHGAATPSRGSSQPPQELHNQSFSQILSRLTIGPSSSVSCFDSVLSTGYRCYHERGRCGARPPPLGPPRDSRRGGLPQGALMIEARPEAAMKAAMTPSAIIFPPIGGTSLIVTRRRAVPAPPREEFFHFLMRETRFVAPASAPSVHGPGSESSSFRHEQEVAAKRV